MDSDEYVGGCGVALAALVGAVSIKFWSAIRLMSRYRVEEYLAIPEARRLYWAGKLTPVAACAAIVVLSYCAHLWWLESPAWLFLAIIVGGVTWRVSGHYAAFYRTI